MKIPGASDIREWDQYTIENEPIASIDLMERAATACVKWLKENSFTGKEFHIFCGKGNNGGDGLAIARMLSRNGESVVVHILEFGHLGTPDFQANLARLHQIPQVEIRFIQTEENFHSAGNDCIVIDALLGSGLNRQLESVTAALANHLNSLACKRISIDIPSGMFTDRSSKGNTMVKAHHTLSFQCYKPAFMVAENGPYLGEVHVLDIGLHHDYYEKLQARFEMTDDEILASIFNPRDPFSHKGTHGHALILAGGYGKMGAAQLCAKSCLRSGAGLVTCHVPKSGYEIMQTAVPEAMVSTDFNTSFLTNFEGDLSKYDALGIGPGIGTAKETRQFLRKIFKEYKGPMVLDADALNIIAMEESLISSIPKGSILTPHPGEFRRLFGEKKNDFELIDLAMERANSLNQIIVLKGHHTLIAIPGRIPLFNGTGNAGMATGGSGDVLTGIITALLAQGYSPAGAAIVGVWMHGFAGDEAAVLFSKESMIAGDIITHLPGAFAYLNTIIS